jgi:tyrosyl-tRNA synthetase
MTDLIHGANATKEAQQASQILFGGGLKGTGEDTFNEIVGEVPTVEIEKSKLEGEGMPILELFVASGLCQSNGQARKDLQGGGINLNNERQSDPQEKITTEALLFGKHLLLRKGKRNYTVLSVK